DRRGHGSACQGNSALTDQTLPVISRNGTLWHGVVHLPRRRPQLHPRAALLTKRGVGRLRSMRWRTLVAAVTVVLAVMAVPAGQAFAGERADSLFQVSVINALMEGAFDGSASFAELRRRGDFGLGTLHA